MIHGVAGPVLGAGCRGASGERRRVPDLVGVPLLVGETDCRVCGLGDAFPFPGHYETCPRCGWVDDPDAYARPHEKSDTNERSLNEAIAHWPAILATSLLRGPLSTFGIAPRHDAIGGFDYLVDGRPLRELFGASVSMLKASIGPWPSSGVTETWLRDGTPDTRSGRSSLYVCPLCGGDGYELALTADVQVRDERTIWSRIGREEGDAEHGELELDLRNGPAGFAFDTRAYRAAFLDVTAK